MANPYKGEISFDAAGQRFKLSFSADAICSLEVTFGKNMVEFGEIFTEPKNIRMADVRAMFIAAFLDAQDDANEAAARSVFKKLSPTDALDVVVRAFNQSFGGEVETSAAANPQKPAAAANGTGGGSSEAGAALASIQTPSGERPPLN